MTNTTGDRLASALDLLRGLPRDRQQVHAARQRVDEWAARLPEAEVALVVDQQPGSARVDYDLLLNDPGGGTVGLTWRADAGEPWLVCHADHWAANGVVTVNGNTATVQQAMMTLRLAGMTSPSLMTMLVDHQIVMEFVEREHIAADAADVQAASDAFRRAMGLHSRDETLRWLAEFGLTPARFEQMVESTVKSLTVRERVVAGRAETYFHDHRDSFDRVLLVRASAPTEAVACRLRDRAAGMDLMSAAKATLCEHPQSGIDVAMTTCHAGELPGPIASATTGAVAGPLADGDRWYVAQIVHRHPACLDEGTRQAVDEVLFEAWLAEQRANATVEWHWM